MSNSMPKADQHFQQEKCDFYLIKLFRFDQQLFECENPNLFEQVNGLVFENIFWQ